MGTALSHPTDSRFNVSLNLKLLRAVYYSFNLFFNMIFTAAFHLTFSKTSCLLHAVLLHPHTPRLGLVLQGVQEAKSWSGDETTVRGRTVAGG